MRSTNSFTKASKPARWVALLAAALLLAGCGSPAPSPTPSPSASESATARPGGTLMLPMLENSTPGNPLKQATREMESIYGMIFESLLTTDDSGAPAPCLAQNWQEADDGVTYTLGLRSGVKWQSTGRALNADDVTFTFDQIKSLAADTTADYPYDYVAKYVSACTKVDDQTVKITMKKPFYGALQALMFPILPSDAGYDNGGAPQLPVGTGPYSVTSYQQGKSIALKANPNWWRAAPLISDVNVMAYPDNPTEISSLVLRQLDAVQTESLTVTQYRDSGDAKVYEYPTRYFEFMALNFTSPDIQDQKIRQAIAYALNRQEIISYTYVNHATISDSPIPPNEGWINGSNLITYDHDAVQARHLIELAGWQDNYDKDGNPLKDANGNSTLDKDGKPLVDDGFYDTSPDGVQRPLEFTLLTNIDQGNTLRNDAAVLIKDQLADAGINVTIKSESWTDYNTSLNQKSFDLALCGCYLSPVPDYTSLLGTGGSLNKGGFSDLDLDAMLLDILQTSDASTLKVKMGELQKKIVDQLPIISLYFRTHSLLYSPDILGVTGAKEDNAFTSISQWYRGS